jgi:hypothetical protein
MENKCKLLDIPKISDPRGNLSFIQNFSFLPFEIKRVFYIYDIPTDESRGAHAHKELHQFIVSLSGSFDVNVKNKNEEKIFHLNRPWQGLYIPPMTWANEENFDSGSIMLVLASEIFMESDYIRDKDQFLSTIGV